MRAPHNASAAPAESAAESEMQPMRRESKAQSERNSARREREPVVTSADTGIQDTVVTASATVPVAIIATESNAKIQPSKVQPAPMPLEELHSVLASAGLTLATTDPEKLRAAQEASANIVVSPRLPRLRKPLPAIADEPLVQVETHH